MIKKLLIRLIILIAGIFLAGLIVPGVNVESYGAGIKAAALLGLLNLSIKPVLFILTLPITLLTLGLFTLVINGFMVWLAGYLVTGFAVSGFLSAVAASVVISILSIILNRFAD